MVLEYLHKHKSYLFDTFNIDTLALFGSYARGENRKDSDIDILFEVKNGKKFSLFDYLKLSSYLEKELKTKVDLVRLEKIKKEILPYVKKDLIFV